MTTQLNNKSKSDDLTPQIYVACLAAYNDGELHGEWITIPDTVEELQSSIDLMLACSPVEDAEEFAIHDYDDFPGYNLNEYESLQDVVELARGVNEHGPAFSFYVGYHGGMHEGITRDFEDAFCGESDSEQDFVEALFRDCYEIPTFIENYIDWERVADDFFTCDYVAFDYRSSVFVFSLL